MTAEHFLRRQLSDPILLVVLIGLGALVYAGVLSVLDRAWISELSGLFKRGRARTGARDNVKGAL